MRTIISLILSTLAVLVTAYLLPGTHVESFLTALVVAVVLAIINTLIFPILLIITLPINILTLGLFTLVIMALLVMLASAIVPGFKVDSFWWAMAFAVVLAIINGFMSQVEKEV